MINNTVKVRVSATSANLGAGFDCLGMAFDLYHNITVCKSDELIIDGCGRDRGKDNLIYKAMNAVFKRAGLADAPVKIVSSSDIPGSSGLGSSAACIVGGVAAANALIGAGMSERDMVNLCASIEGHPDNTTPAITGGVTACVLTDGGVEYIKCSLPKPLCCCVATPDFSLPTAKARAALPGSYSREDCVYSLSRAVVTFGALMSGEYEKLALADDRLHQPYRIPLIKGYGEATEAFKAAGAISCCISGAGPSVLAFFTQAPHTVALPKGWTLRVMSVENSPVRVIVE